MKRVGSTVLSVILICQMMVMTVFAKPDWPSDTGIMAEAGIVIDMDSGTMIFGQNSRQAYFPASITKLVTAYVVLQHAKPDEVVTFSDDAVNNVESGSGNSLSLAVGDTLTVEDCLYAMLLRSSNQAANALAEHVGGTRDGFVDMMNEAIAELGCTGSHFKNPSGLNDPEQLVTPYDMAQIARVAFADPELLKIASAKSYKLPATSLNPDGLTISIEHRLLREGDELHYPDAVAGKTGWTSLAGNTLVTYAERDGRRLIAVVLKGSQPQYYADTVTLLNFGFDRFQNVDVAEQGLSYTTGEAPVTIGGESYSPSDLMYSSPSVITLPENAAFADAEETLDTELPEDHPAGAVAVLRYTYNERRIGEVYLCSRSAAEAASAAALAGEDDDLAESLPETEPETQPETTAPEEETEPGRNEPERTRNGGITTILWGIGAVILVLILAAGGYLVYERKQEEKRRIQRRERRLQRLLEDGHTEEEFERMIEEQRQKKEQRM